VVESGLPQGLANQLGSIILDSRYATAATRTRLRSAMATAAAGRRETATQQQQQLPSLQSPGLEPGSSRSFSSWPACYAAAAHQCNGAGLWQQPEQQHVQLLERRQRLVPLPHARYSTGSSCMHATASSISSSVSSSNSSRSRSSSRKHDMHFDDNSWQTKPALVRELQQRSFFGSSLVGAGACSQQFYTPHMPGWWYAMHTLRVLRRCLH
jgi:hypothetical protein